MDKGGRSVRLGKVVEATNKRIKKLWIAALRSGKFKQAKDNLRVGRGKNAGYCCLGVLEAIRCEKTGIKFRNTTDGELPPAAVKWAGLPDGNPVAGDSSLAEYNDGGKSFKFIARKIEKYF